MRRARLRLPVALAAVALLAAGCERNQDERALRAALSATANLPRAFVYAESTQDRWFQAEGTVEDDFRYRLTLSAKDGPLLEMVVMDDALAVHLLRPKAFPGLAFGHPPSEAALLAGKWVVDPAGAPPLVPPPDPDARRKPPSPLDAPLSVLDEVLTAKSRAWGVKKFSLEDLDYRPNQDPWLYPSGDGEVRYDLVRPWLPKREGQILQGPGVSEANFRKVSVFVREKRVTQVCERVDIVGHEEFQRMRAQKAHNPFLESLEAQALEGHTDPPIRPRWVYTGLTFPGRVALAFPGGALTARLDGFLAALRGKLAELLPAGGPTPAECLRNPDEATPA